MGIAAEHINLAVDVLGIGNDRSAGNGAGMVGEEGSWGVGGVARAIATGLDISRTTSAETHGALAGRANPGESLNEEEADQRTFANARILVVAVALANPATPRGMIKGAVDRTAALRAAEDAQGVFFLGVAEGVAMADCSRGATVAGGAGSGARGLGEGGWDLDFADPIGTPRRGTRLDQVGDMALIVHEKGRGLQFVTLNDRGDGDGGKNLTPGKEDAKVACRV